MADLSKDAARSLYLLRTVSKESGIVNRELGYGYMGQKYIKRAKNYVEDGEPMLVSSTSVLSNDLLHELESNSSKVLQAVRYYKPINKSHKIIIIDPKNVERCTINTALSVVRNFATTDGKSIKYAITFDWIKDPFNESIDVCAYAFKNNDIIPINLSRDRVNKIIKVNLNKKDFAEEKAKGAPIIKCWTSEYKAFGFLDFKDGKLQPVFIDERTYESYKSPPHGHMHVKTSKDDQTDIPDIGCEGQGANAPQQQGGSTEKKQKEAVPNEEPESSNSKHYEKQQEHQERQDEIKKDYKEHASGSSKTKMNGDKIDSSVRNNAVSPDDADSCKDDNEHAGHLPHMGNFQPIDKPTITSANPDTDIKLEDLWEDINFRDELCRALDVEHKFAVQLKNWRHLAHEFKESIRNIPRGTLSPTEALLEHLESTQPGLTVGRFCVALKEAKANQVSRFLNKSIEEHKLQHQDLVSEMATKACDVLSEVVLKLDKQDLWEKVAKKLGIKENIYSVFTRDPKPNPTRALFDVLRAHSPSLNISDMITNLEQLGENYLSSKLSTQFQGDRRLTTLSSNASFMCGEIERILNDPKSEMLYKLAGKFKEKGKILGDFKIDVFRPQEDVQSPTEMLIEKVTTSHEEEYSAQDLIERLRKIERNDCVDIVGEYVRKIVSASNEH